MRLFVSFFLCLFSLQPACGIATEGGRIHGQPLVWSAWSFWGPTENWPAPTHVPWVPLQHSHWPKATPQVIEGYCERWSKDIPWRHDPGQCSDVSFQHRHEFSQAQNFLLWFASYSTFWMCRFHAKTRNTHQSNKSPIKLLIHAKPNARRVYPHQISSLLHGHPTPLEIVSCYGAILMVLKVSNKRFILCLDASTVANTLTVALLFWGHAMPHISPSYCIGCIGYGSQISSRWSSWAIFLMIPHVSGTLSHKPPALFCGRDSKDLKEKGDFKLVGRCILTEIFFQVF